MLGDLGCRGLASELGGVGWNLTSALRKQVEDLDKENKQLKGDNEKLVSSLVVRADSGLTAIARAGRQIQGEGELLRLLKRMPEASFDQH